MVIQLDSTQIFEIFKMLDSDGDGVICYKEFCELLEDRRNGMDPIFNDAGPQAVKIGGKASVKKVP